MKLSYLKKLNIAFSISLFLLLLSSAASYYTIREFKHSVEQVNHSYILIAKLELLLSKLKDAETGTRGFILSNSEEFLEPYQDSDSQSLDILNEIKVMTQDDAEHQRLIPLLQRKISQRFEAAQELILTKRLGRVVTLDLMTRGKEVMDQLRKIVSAMQLYEREVLTARVERSGKLSTMTHFLIVIVSLLAIIITYEFCKRLKKGYFKKTLLQRKLQHLSILMSRRIAIIEKVAAKISQGEYHIRVENSEKDALGSLAMSLNRMAASLEESFNAVRELMQKKDDFIGIAAHELKTPLTTIKASLQFMSRIKFEGASRNVTPFIIKASHQTNRLTEIVRDLLDVNIINKGKLDLKMSIFSIREILPEAANALVLNQNTHKLTLKGDPNITICADKFRIEQVLINLISNAIKYSPNSNEIIIEITKVEKDVKVAVTDFGVGIPKDKIPFIFDRYYRVHETSQYYAGLGLGLYISSEIIKNHGGKIGLISEEGKGSTFWFTIPIGTDLGGMKYETPH